MRQVETIDELQQKRKKAIELDAIEKHPLGERLWRFRRNPSVKKTLVEKQLD